jgi:hypothetical protein
MGQCGARVLSAKVNALDLHHYLNNKIDLLPAKPPLINDEFVNYPAQLNMQQ